MVSSRTVRTVSRVRFSLARPRSCPSASPFACAHRLRAVPPVCLSLSPPPCHFVPSAPPRVVPPALYHLAPAHYAPSLRRHVPRAAVARRLDPRHALSRAVVRPRRGLVPRGALLRPTMPSRSPCDPLVQRDIASLRSCTTPHHLDPRRVACRPLMPSRTPLRHAARCGTVLRRAAPSRPLPRSPSLPVAPSDAL
ncbi:hypothetical protein DENSPDRAFT_887319 [Dentipellis sp. KUC8613]|nr:hypothetical protein DENSPDRAFT_887319 [Dentipellis sp. KUC8613]